MHAPTLPGMILILLAALILFGPKKLPELGRVLGKTLREFKNSASGLIEEEEGKEKKHSK
ncbi:twin-arginine translocase TatA/TatE family subunit [Kroppenstedtia eburnea]|uniref:Sec-independent protein translocase protein TatA n=1 Tax=Kroppenstedtia eburnea TaxID=714067 RepID=A0A1N7M5H0_9BACL|nr:twin-arginine translocase TatA/TatE family subunit [Kroppenstedtia eburnea]QKI81840.1 twin-arginine translocase TatA/TatE family subunit [Kroppenstedtia eburnea]SIS81356.1 sec-independent protein translocase protein TatA [Kroppenstedtia eburnea]